MDYRVEVGWRSHPKRARLRRKLGSRAVLAMMDLWEFCAFHKQDGDLSGMDAAEIAEAAGWRGDAEAFVETLAEIELLDGAPGAYRVHDWAERQPWVVGAKTRSIAARAAAEARWSKSPASMRPASKRTMPLSSPLPSSPTPSSSRARANGATTTTRGRRQTEQETAPCASCGADVPLVLRNGRRLEPEGVRCKGCYESESTGKLPPVPPDEPKAPIPPELRAQMAAIGRGRSR